MAASPPSISDPSNARGNQTRASDSAPDPATATAGTWPSEVVLLGAADRDQLLKLVDELLAYLSRESPGRLVDLAATLNRALPTGGVRLALVATDVADLSRRLTASRKALADAACQRLRDPSGTYFETAPLGITGKVAFVFPGEGAQYQGMLAGLPGQFPVVRTALSNYDTMIGPDGDDASSLSRFFLAPAELPAEKRELLEGRLRQIDFAMFAVLGADWSVAQVLDGLKLAPAAVCGHSAGELAALAFAGAFNMADDATPIIDAMRALGEAENLSGKAEAILLATAASRETIETVAAAIPEVISSGPNQNIFVGMDNCPHQTVVVGSHAAMEKVEAALKQQRVMCERLPFSRPYHTPLFEPFMGPLTEMFDAVTFTRPRQIVYSCTSARPFDDDPEAIREAAQAHWRSPVQFRQLVQNLYADGVRVFVEAGPRGLLSAFIQDTLRGREFLALPADLPRRSALAQLNQLVAQLSVHQVPIDVDYLYRNRGVVSIDWRRVSERVNVAPPAPVAAPTQSAKATPGVAAPSTTGAPPTGPAAVVARHFEVMEQFLATQQAIAHDYLQARSQRSGASPPAKPRTIPAAVSRGVTPPIAPRQVSQPKPTSPVQPAQPPRQASGPGDFPMGGAVISQVPERELVLRRRLDLAEDRYANEHTVGGLDISRVNPKQRGLPVMPMTFIIEMMAEAAVRLMPGRVAIAIRDVRLQRWLDFDEESVPSVEITARRAAAPSEANVEEVEVEVRYLGVGDDASSARGAVSQSVVVLARDYPAPPAPKPMELTNERPCTVTLSTLYRNLFHGPCFQGVRTLERFGDEGLVSMIEVQPRDELFRSCKAPRFLVDPVTVDIGMHPAAAWHLEQPDQSGRILLPFELKRIEFFGPSPAVGTKILTHSWIAHSTPRQFNHRGELILEDGRLWCRLTDVKCWRFYMPFGEVNFNGPKDEYFISHEWPAVIPHDDGQPRADTVCMNLDPSGDMSSGGMQGAAARVALSDREMRTFRQKSFGTAERTEWLFSRMAMKDAARTWWRQQAGEKHFMADLEIEDDPRGRPTIRMRAGSPPTAPCPTVAVAYLPKLIVALATRQRWAGVGLMSVNAGEADAQWNELEPNEQQALATLPGDRPQQLARALAARCALRNALGPALIAEQCLVRIAGSTADGCVLLQLDGSLNEVFPDLQGLSIRVCTHLADTIAIATVVGPQAGGAR